MFLEEKLDLFKKTFHQEDFKIPFTAYTQIIKKIEARFIHSTDLNLKYNGWSESLKNVNKEYTIDAPIANWLSNELSKEINYWWVFVEGERTTDRHRLFDAKTLPGQQLINLFSNCSFFIIDKKYNWMIAIEPKSNVVREIGKRESEIRKGII